ncbi:MAG: outer membrane protein assembly factor BamD [Acidobacteriaceae bacterium]|nr:outer membrane protein assembly factor BamD [Acidobacteriaceae bacterium]
MLRTPPYATSNHLAILLVIAIFLMGATESSAQILHKKKKVDKSTSADNNVQPDKVLYDRAADDIKHGKHEVGRLNLQTLINTYPDSEYLAKAKLLIADSYYKEGGTANMTQAISGYKDFIVFFPFLPEASYAQLQVAMGHFRQMEKPDRDRTEAKEAESEFQTFLQKYPKDPLADKAMQHLREVQEVIAEGDFRVASYYYTKGDQRAAAARLIGVTNRYPLYSRADRALWMLGEIFDNAEKKEVAANYYARIVKNYPLSSEGPQAKNRLVAMKVPVPQPDPKARARMVADQNAPRPRTSLAKKPLGILHSGPTGEMRAAARVGEPNLEPEADTSSATDVLKGGNSSRIVVGGSGGGGTGATSGNTAGIVATVTPGGAKTEESGNAEGTAPADANAPADGATSPGTGPASPQPESSSATPGESTSAAPASPNSGDAAVATGSDTSGTTASGTATTTDVSKTDTANTEAGNQGDNTKESSSKKKKGMRKLVPW